MCSLPIMQAQDWLQVQPLHLAEATVGPSPLPASQPLQASHRFRTLLVLSGNGPAVDLPETCLTWLVQQFNNASELILIGNVCESLAATGVLDERMVACHWSQYERLKTAYSRVNWSQQLYCQEPLGDSKPCLMTCAGGGATADVLLAWLLSHGYAQLAAEVTEWLLLERGRSADAVQRIPLQARLGNRQPKLTEAVTLMESNLDEPLSSDDLAGLVGLSRRHLERLFKRHLDTVPSRFYLQLRLDKARQLLRDTDMSIVEVSMAAGFSSASHFSTTYRSHFSITPRQERGRSTSVEMGNNLPNLVALQSRLD
ncbi:MAG TPA: AraC family transcriptional regulator [Oceanospirillaceae bacterium]|nr:AraC family transcriptional regulator [Oceanospirillaceae bacterium]